MKKNYPNKPFFRSLPVFAFFCFFLLSLNRNIDAGSYQITSAGYSTAGLSYSTSGTGTLVNDTTGFYTNTSAVEWTISGFNIRAGQSWSNLSLTVTPGTGSTFDIYIYSDSQAVVYSALAQNASKSIDLTTTDFAILTSKATFSMKIVFRPGAPSVKITNITATYTGNMLVCYPSPYQISNGSLTLVFEVNSDSKVTLDLYDNRGRLVKNLFKDKSYTGGATRFKDSTTWDGKDSTGRIVNTGIYTAVVTVTPSNASLTKDKYISSFRVLVFR